MTMGAAVAERPKQLSASIFPRHEAIVQAIRRKRTIEGDAIPSTADVIRDAIEELGRRELDPERFEELMGDAS